MLVELRPECLLGDVTCREGALPTVGLQVRTLILHATSTRVPDTHSAVRWATKWHTGGEQWLGIPRVRSPEGWSGWGTAVTPLRLGVACAWTQPPVTAQLPRPLKISVRHKSAHLRYNYTQLTQSLHSDTPQATRSTARRVSQECLTRVVCSRFSKQGGAFEVRQVLSPPASSADVTSSFAGTSQLFSSQETASIEGVFFAGGINFPKFRPFFSIVGWDLGLLSFRLPLLSLFCLLLTVFVLLVLVCSTPHSVVLVLVCALPESFQCWRQTLPLRGSFVLESQTGTSSRSVRLALGVRRCRSARRSTSPLTATSSRLAPYTGT